MTIDLRKGFSAATKYLEENHEEATISGSRLCEIMGNHGCDPYSPVHMKKKLIEKYKDDVIIIG